MGLERHGNEYDLERESMCREIAALKEEKEQARIREAETRKKLSLYGDILSSMRDWFWEVNENLVFTYCSERTLDTKGYTPTEMLGHSLLEFIVPEDRTGIEEIADEIIRSQKSFENVEGWCNTREGGKICFLASGVPFYNAEGKFMGYRGINQDITERKREEIKRIESEKRFREIIECSRNIIYRQNIRDGNVDYMSPASMGILGYFPEEIQAMQGGEEIRLFYPDDRGVIVAFKDDIISADKRGERFIEREFRMISKQGDIRWIHGRYQMIRDARGNPEHVVGTLQDITARKLMEEEREHTLAILQATLESTEEGILVVNASGDVSGYNQKLLRMWNISESEIVRLNTVEQLEYMASRIKEPEKIIARVNEFDECLEQEGSGIIELLDGRVFEWYCRPKRIGDAVVGRVWSFRDVTLRLRTEIALRQSEATLRSVFDATPVGLAFLRDRVIESANDSLCEALGYTRRELVGSGTEKLYFSSQDYESVGQLYREVERNGRGSMETRLRKKNGDAVHVILTGGMLHADNPAHGFVVTFQDITARKQAEESLRASERRYREIFDSTPISIWEYDISGALRVIEENAVTNREEFNDFIHRNPELFDRLLSAIHLIDVNRETVLMYGARDKEEIRRIFGSYWLPEVKEMFRRLVADYLAGESLVRTETVNMTVDGRKIDILLHVSFTGEMRRTGRVLIAILNITDRKNAERELRESDERNRKIFEATRDGFALVDESGGFVEVNDAFCVLAGYEREELIGMSVGVIAVNRDGMPSSSLQRSFALRGFDRFEIGLRQKSGKIIEVEVSITYLTGKNLFAAFVRDITERKRLEHQLVQAQKMETVGRLAGGVAHDFNNILTVINANAELGIMRMDSSDPKYEIFEEIRKSGERAAELTRQLLAFSRKQIVEPRVINLNQILLGMEKMLRRLIGENIEMKTLPEKCLNLVKVDPGQIEQVLTNLVVNARDAMPGGGALTLETRNVSLYEEDVRIHPGMVPGKYVMLVVTDTGIGMNEDVLSHIFEPFFTTKTVGNGTGLGLSTCYGIVKQNNGYIMVFSEKGKGTEFKVYLPVSEEKEKSFIAEHSSKDIPGGTETVLVAEDDAIIRGLVVRYLSTRGYLTLSAANGEEALAMALNRKNPIHLLITDVVMPIMGGRELADRITAIQPGIHILFMSGYTEDSIVHQSVLNQGVNFIQKPFSMGDFMRKIREALEE